MTKAWPAQPFEGNQNWTYVGSTQNIDVWTNTFHKHVVTQYRVQFGPDVKDFRVFTGSFLKLTYYADQIDHEYPWLEELMAMVELSKDA